MAKMNSGNWGAFINAVPQGMETEQKLTEQDLMNRYRKNAMVDPATQENQYWTQKRQQWQQQNGQQPWQDQGMLFDPVRNALADVYKSAKAKLSSFLPGQNQHAMGPASQSIVNQQTNAPMSAPSPTSSNAPAGAFPGASGPLPLPQTDAQVGQPRPFADGGIPARKPGGALRQRPAKPGNVAKPTKAAQAAMHPPMERPPVDNQEMGAEGGPPRNTDAQPSNQDPMLADGGYADGNFIQGAIKRPGQLHRDLGVPQGEKIPKSKIKAAEERGGKVGKRAQLAETMSKFANGGAVDRPQPFKPAAEPKPQPNAVEKDVNNDGQRNRLGKTIKRFADGGDPKSDEPAPGLEPAQKWPGVIPALRNAAHGVGVAAQPIVNAGRAASEAVNNGIETFLTGDPHGLSGRSNTGPVGAQPAASPPPASGASPMQGPPAPYDDNPGIIEHGPPAGGAGMVTTAPDGTPITPYSRQGMSDALRGTGGGGEGAIPGRGAAPEQGPPKPTPVDFSQVQMDHQDIPNTSTQEWDKMKKGIVEQLIATRKAGPEQAAMIADDQVSQFQHQNFMQYMQQGIALDRAGNKAGAMAALKTAYNYMPTGHGMHFGVDPKTGNIVGVGYDEDTQKPVGAPVMLDQQNLNHLMATYSDPKNFQGETVAMMEQKRKNFETTQGQVPYMQAHAGLAGSQAAYFQGRNETTLEAAAIRHAAAGGSKLPAQTQKFYAQQLNGAIVDPREQGEALGVAEILEGRYGNSPQTQGKIVGLLKQMYSMPLEQRAQFAAQNKIPLPGLTQESQMDPQAMYGMYGQGYGVPPR